MKKILTILILILLISGCGDISNTPIKQVEGFFNKYQILDQDVLNDLDDVIESRGNFSEENKQKYREIIKKQYKNLTYQIKEEIVNAYVATVITEITVLDFSKILAEAQNHKQDNPEMFFDANGEYDEQLYYSYVISKIEQAEDKVKYTLEINLSKIDDKWKIDAIDSDTEDKILGVYQYSGT